MPRLSLVVLGDRAPPAAFETQDGYDAPRTRTLPSARAACSPAALRVWPARRAESPRSVGLGRTATTSRASSVA